MQPCTHSSSLDMAKTFDLPKAEDISETQTIGFQSSRHKIPALSESIGAKMKILLTSRSTGLARSLDGELNIT